MRICLKGAWMVEDEENLAISRPHPKSLKEKAGLLPFWPMSIWFTPQIKGLSWPRNHRSLKIRTSDFIYTDKSTLAVVLHTCAYTQQELKKMFVEWLSIDQQHSLCEVCSDIASTNQQFQFSCPESSSSPQVTLPQFKAEILKVWTISRNITWELRNANLGALGLRPATNILPSPPGDSKMHAKGWKSLV